MVYTDRDEVLGILLVMDVDEEGDMLSLSLRLNALKSLPYTLSRINIADFLIPKNAGDTKLLCAAGGYTYDNVEYPPSMLRDTILTVKKGEPVTIHSNMTGRSSDEHLPIWVAQIDDSGGVWYGPEWSGSWEMHIAHEDAGVRISLGLPSMNFRMFQGEEIDLPSFLIGSYKGDIWAGSNKLRRTIKDKLAPKIGGNPVHPRVIFQGLNGIEPYEDEKYFIREVRRAAGIGAENFVLDAGWNYAPNAKLHDADGRELDTLKPWYQKLGDWTYSKERFPSGLDKFGVLVKSLDMRFGIWIEPRVSPGMPDSSEYRDILLQYKEDVDFWNGIFHKQYLVDLGKKRGEDYFFNTIEKFVEEYHAGWLWFDFNANPGPRSVYWDELEEPDRRGIMELRFYRGLYSFFERLLRKYPDLWIESCAAGGRIIDLGVIRRCHSVWVSDFSAFGDEGQNGDNDICRNMRSGLNKFIPAVYIQNAIFIPRAVQESAEPYPLYNYLCHFAGDLQYGQGILDWKQKDVEMATYITSKYKVYRRYLEEDFYQITPIPKDKTGWDGWQFDDPKTDSGILILFRMADCEEPVFKAPVHRITGYKRYTFDVVLGNGTVSVTDNGITAGLKNKFDAMLVHYSIL
jgi:alpha-galactosidase